MQLTRIYLIRHAEAEGNRYRRVHGQYDSLLTPRGERQITALRVRFEKIDLDHVYASPLYRARMTAKAVAEPKQLAVELEPGIIEISMGSWEDLPWGEVARKEPERLAQFRDRQDEYQLEGGESYEQLQTRQVEAYLRLARENEGKTIACVSHSMAIRTFMGWCHRVPISQLSTVPRSDNTGVTCIEITDGKPTILFEADNTHLPEELSTLKRQTWWKEDKSDLNGANLWFRPWNPEAERGLYLQFRKEAWNGVHKGDPFDGDGFYNAAKAQSEYDRRAVMVVMYQNHIAGMVQLDLQRDAEQRVGFIPFCYLTPGFRCHGLGGQLIGQAVSTFRPLGRERLRLRCAPNNAVAKRFYRNFGFEYAGPATDSKVKLDLLEKDITFHE